ncbi:MAG: type III pantothenate kinase [Candidatus Sumerlaeaceae bacterium]|nr:type III pantothenate kinase [Candidatus Sumerlaeaceae bacterium]
MRFNVHDIFEAQMILVLDIGNTNITMGLFQDHRCARLWRLGSEARRTSDEYSVLISSLLRRDDVDPSRLQAVVIGSVVPVLSDILDAALAAITGCAPYHVTHKAKMTVKNCYGNPREVGIDRLANAVAGVAAIGAPLIVVDFGTAVTLDVISRKREYLGGVIMPGIELSAEALARRTARLPQIATIPSSTIIGSTTVDSIRSGILNGLVGAVDHLITGIWKELGYKTRTAATGGQAPLFVKQSAHVRKALEDLTLAGLYEIWKLNLKSRRR